MHYPKEIIVFCGLFRSKYMTTQLNCRMCCDTLYFYVRKTRSNFEFRYVFQFTNKRINILNQIVNNDFISNSLFLQETSFASNQPVTRSLSSVTNNNKSKLPLPKSVISNGYLLSGHYCYHY